MLKRIRLPPVRVPAVDCDLMQGNVSSRFRRTSLLVEIESLRAELTELEQSETELRSSLADARKQLSYYRNLVAKMKRAVSPTNLKKVIRLL